MDEAHNTMFISATLNGFRRCCQQPKIALESTNSATPLYINIKYNTYNIFYCIKTTTIQTAFITVLSNTHV